MMSCSKARARRFAFLGVLAACAMVLADRARADEQKLQNASKRVERHATKILEEFNRHEQYGKSVSEKVQDDGKSKQWKCGNDRCPGAKEHPWDPNANQNSEEDYKKDSGDVMTNEQENLTELWSCFEPGRIKYTPPPDPLDVLCKSWCPTTCPLPGSTCPGLRVWQPPQNRHEVIEEWRPYHVAYINNYGINRLNPSEQEAKGDRFMKSELVANKDESEEEEKRLLDDKKADDSSKFVPPDRSENKGQGHGAGFFMPSDMMIDKLYGHGARTRWSYKFSEDRDLKNCWGYMMRPQCISNTSWPKREEKDILNLWTEYGMLDVVWNMPEMTKRHGQRERDMYEATAYPESPIPEAGKNGKEWDLSKSPPAWRKKTWQKTYGDLKDLEFQDSNNQKQEEFVYFGGGELGPLTGTINASLGMPELAAGAYLARRTFYIMGSPQFNKYQPDQANAEKGRMNEYTVMRSNKSREIDKMQRIWPRIGNGNKPSQCFRSQRIPNMVHTTENNWAKENFPYDLIHYVDEHYGEMTYAYWNKVVYCACEYCSDDLHSGCSLMERRIYADAPGPVGRGDGDQDYGQFENLECQYREGNFPSAWQLRYRQCGNGDRRVPSASESKFEGNRDQDPDV